MAPWNPCSSLTSVAPACGDNPTWSTSTLFSAAAFGVATIESSVGTSAPTIVPRNTASTSPLTDLKAPFGLSASRRAASSGDGPCATRANSHATAAVSHGPAITRPIMMMSRPG